MKKDLKTSRKTVRLVAVLLLVPTLLCVALAAYEIHYAVAVYPKQQQIYGELLTYKPFSGKLFQIDSAAEFGDICYHITPSYYETLEDIEEIEIEDPSVVTQLIALLNDFRYHFWVFRDRHSRQPPRRSSVGITLQSAKRVSPYTTIVFENNCFLMDEVWYYGDPAYFERLYSLLTE